MPTLHFPALLVEQHRGIFTAYRVDGDEQASSDSGQDALEQLRELLAWAHHEAPDEVRADFDKPTLLKLSVGVRPELRDKERSFPSEDVVSLRIHAVRGVRESGLNICAIPELNASLYFHEEDNLSEMVQHAVQSHFRGATPAQVHRHIAPRSVSLETVSFKVPVSDSHRRHRLVLPTLEHCAEPLLGGGRRKVSQSPAFERDNEVARLEQLLSVPGASVLIVGESGSGKTTVLVEALRHLRRANMGKEEENDRHTPRFWRTSGARIISGMTYLGQWQERCDTLIEELAQVDGILCIDELLELVRTGGAQAGDGVGAYLVPYLRAGQLRLVAEVTPSGLEACRHLLPALVEQCRLLALEPMNRSQATRVLQKAAASLEQNRRLKTEDDAIQTLIGLYSRFMPYRALPGVALDLLRKQVERLTKETAATAKAATAKTDTAIGPASAPESASSLVQATVPASVPTSVPAGAAHNKAGRGTPTRLTANPSSPSTPQLPLLTRETVVAAFIRETGLPEFIVKPEVVLTHTMVYDALRARVIAQEAACDTLAGMVMTFKAALNDAGRPVGVYLLSGPTGVGKTELARTLSRYLFSHSDGAERLIRLDMSEYSGPGAVHRLLTRPDGEPSALIQQVRQQPFMVLLLDEIEKAAPEVFDLLLGVLDEGRLTDRFGRTTYFRSAIILLTSNLGARRQEAPGFASRSPVGSEAEVMSFFRPEFFNRLDGVLTFHPLELPAIRQIVRLELGQLLAREGLARRRLTLKWTERLETWLAQTGYHIQYGARPLQRAVETAVVSPLARYLLAHPTLSNTTLVADLDADGRVQLETV